MIPKNHFHFQKIETLSCPHLTDTHFIISCSYEFLEIEKENPQSIEKEPKIYAQMHTVSTVSLTGL
jgi:hypothetical protein